MSTISLFLISKANIADFVLFVCNGLTIVFFVLVFTGKMRSLLRENKSANERFFYVLLFATAITICQVLGTLLHDYVEFADGRTFDNKILDKISSTVVDLWRFFESFNK